MLNDLEIQEKRRHERFEAEDLPVRIFDSANEYPQVSLTDISSGGFGLSLTQRLSAGQILRFQVALPAGTISGTGVVRWSESDYEGFRGGVEIQDLGWLQSRKLRSFLKPFSPAKPRQPLALPEIDVVDVFDTMLWAGTLVIGLVCFAEFLGFDLLGLAQKFF